MWGTRGIIGGTAENILRGMVGTDRLAQGARMELDGGEIRFGKQANSMGWGSKGKRLVQGPRSQQAKGCWDLQPSCRRATSRPPELKVACPVSLPYNQ